MQLLQDSHCGEAGGPEGKAQGQDWQTPTCSGHSKRWPASQESQKVTIVAGWHSNLMQPFTHADPRKAVGEKKRTCMPCRLYDTRAFTCESGSEDACALGVPGTHGGAHGGKLQICVHACVVWHHTQTGFTNHHS